MRVPELLAPVGNYESLEAALAGGADAVYLGGKELNMRVRRPGYNFTVEELKEIIPFVKERGIKAYFTLNSLIHQEQLKTTSNLLEFLQEQKVDGVIVQDLGVVKLARALTPKLPLHASTQMNIHNGLGGRMLEKLGLKRVVLAREVNLREIEHIRQQTSLELEFFVFGSRCISYSGQCYLSSALGGGGGNQGFCSKPCRLPYSFTGAGDIDYYLSPKDTSLLAFLPQLIRAGISSFKIEGRMEDKAFLQEVIRQFRQAIDSYCQGKKLELVNQPGLTTGYLTGKPGREYFQLKEDQKKLGYRFQQPFTSTFPIRALPVKYLEIPGSCQESSCQPLLAVWVKDLAGLESAQDAQIFYLGGEHLRSWGERPTYWPKHQKILQNLRRKGKKIYLALPNIAKEEELAAWQVFLQRLEQSQWDGLLVSSLGSLALAKQETKLPLCLDQNLNIFNEKSLALLSEYGIERFCLHPEGEYSWLTDQPQLGEAVIWGPYPGMILETCLLEAFLACAGKCPQDRVNLKFSNGRILRIETDLSCRNHVFLRKKINLLGEIPKLRKMGVQVLRIDGRWLKPKNIRTLIKSCQEQLEGEGLA